MKYRETKQLGELLKLVEQGKLDSNVVILFLQLVPDIAAARNDAPGKAENMPPVTKKKKYAMKSRKAKQLDKLLRSVEEGRTSSEDVDSFLSKIHGAVTTKDDTSVKYEDMETKKEERPSEIPKPDAATTEDDKNSAMICDNSDSKQVGAGEQAILNSNKKSSNKIYALHSVMGGIHNFVNDDPVDLRPKTAGQDSGVIRPEGKREGQSYAVPRTQLHHTAYFKNKQTSINTQPSTDPDPLPRFALDTSAELPSTLDALPKFSLRDTARSKSPRSEMEDSTSSAKSKSHAYSEPSEPLNLPPKRVLRETRRRRAPEAATDDFSAPAWARKPEVTFYDHRMDTADVVKKMATEKSPFPRGATKPNVTTDDRNEDVADVVEKLANSDKTNKSVAVTRPTIDSAAVEDICPHLFDCPCDLIKVCLDKDCDGQCGEIHGKPCREFLKGKCQRAVPCEWGTHDPANREKWQAITDFKRMLAHE